MKDEEYVRELLAILTNPRPTGINPNDPYGQADDGIDRYNGFGRDVRVVSIDVVRGEHGLELEVAFGLAVPRDKALRDMPDRGSVRVPFDRYWRRLSGYEKPAAYAPAVAREVEHAAGSQFQQHRSGPGKAPRLPSRQEQWRLLLDALADEGTVREIGPGRLEVAVRDDDVVTVVVSPDEWEHVLAALDGGDIGPGIYVAELIGPRDEDERFVVFYKGGLVRSTREELPPVRGRAHERELAELRAQHPDGLYWSGPGGDRLS